MNNRLHSVGDLSPTARQALASAAGISIDEGQQFYIVLVNNADQQERRRALERLNEIAREAEKNIAASGVPLAELDAAIDDAADRVRRSRRT